MFVFGISAFTALAIAAIGWWTRPKSWPSRLMFVLSIVSVVAMTASFLRNSQQADFQKAGLVGIMGF
jgi:hypothetical protein